MLDCSKCWTACVVNASNFDLIALTACFSIKVIACLFLKELLDFCFYNANFACDQTKDKGLINSVMCLELTFISNPFVRCTRELHHIVSQGFFVPRSQLSSDISVSIFPQQNDTQNLKRCANCSSLTALKDCLSDRIFTWRLMDTERFSNDASIVYVGLTSCSRTVIIYELKQFSTQHRCVLGI